MNVLVDSSGWIEYFAKGPKSPVVRPYIHNKQGDTLLTPSIVLFETHKKIKTEFGEPLAYRAMAYIQDASTVIDLDARMAINSSEVSLRTKLPLADAVIYATSELFRAKIVTLDRHFKGLPNVELL